MPVTFRIRGSKEGYVTAERTGTAEEQHRLGWIFPDHIVVNTPFSGTLVDLDIVGQPPIGDANVECLENCTLVGGGTTGKTDRSGQVQLIVSEGGTG